MTYKEKLAAIIGSDHKVFDEKYIGGVKACPKDVFKNVDPCDIFTGNFRTCEQCWNRTYKGEEFKREFLGFQSGQSYREKLAEIVGKEHPCFNPIFDSGVHSCPSHAFRGATPCRVAENCTDCWDQPYKGERYNPTYGSDRED